MNTSPPTTGLLEHSPLPIRLRAAYLTFHRLGGQLARPLGATADQYVVLALLLSRDEPYAQNEIVAELFSDPNTVAAMITSLEARGWIERSIDPEDGRRRLVSATDAGREIHDRLHQQMLPLRRIVDEAVPPEQRQEFLTHLDRLIAVLTDIESGRKEIQEAA